MHFAQSNLQARRYLPAGLMPLLRFRPGTINNRKLTGLILPAISTRYISKCRTFIFVSSGQIIMTTGEVTIQLRHMHSSPTREIKQTPSLTSTWPSILKALNAHLPNTNHFNQCLPTRYNPGYLLDI